jgi:hypothetical protein
MNEVLILLSEISQEFLNRKYINGVPVQSLFDLLRFKTSEIPVWDFDINTQITDLFFRAGKSLNIECNTYYERCKLTADQENQILYLMIKYARLQAFE